jgi:hypothetical protein
MLRRLLNTGSIVCLVLCVALTGMWVRSYHAVDELRGRFTDWHVFGIISMPGRLGYQDISFFREPAGWHSSLQSNRIDRSFSTVLPNAFLPFFGFDEYFDGKIWPAVLATRSVLLPYWALVISSGSLAMIFRLRLPWRFTLRTLFIVTTFLAVVLGMIAWLDQAWIGK